VAIAKKLDLKSHRFSISWPRIQADGTGKANPKGLDYYKRLTDELNAADPAAGDVVSLGFATGAGR
jgi:beta-glucosidase